MIFVNIYIIYQNSVLCKYISSIIIGSSYSELKLAVQYNSETDERYSPWIQAIKSLKEKPRTTITKEEKNWWKDKDHRPNIVQKKLEGNTKEKQAEILESYKIPTKELEKFVLAQEHANDGVKEYKTVLAAAGNQGSKFGGIVKSIGASLASAGINMLIGIGIDLLIKGIDKAIHYSEDLRKASTELTNQYKDEKESLDDNRQSYEELAKKMQNANLTTDEVKSNKEELAKIQQEIVDKCGLEAEGIDLVNGKYDEQIKKLDELSRQKANDYVIENGKNIEADKKKISGNVIITTGSYIQTNPSVKGWEKGQKTFDLWNEYFPDDKMEKDESGRFVPHLSGDIADLREKLSTASSKIISEKGKNDDTKQLLDKISKLYDALDVDEYDQSLKNVKDYSKALVLSNDNYYDTYTDLQNAINDYNTALQSGENVDQAFDNLTRIQDEVTEITQSTDDAKYAFDDLLDSIDRGRETDYKIKVGLETNKDEVQNILQSFKDNGVKTTDLFDIDINADDTNIPEIQQQFKDLCRILGITQDEVDTLLTKLSDDKVIIDIDSEAKSVSDFTKNVTDLTTSVRKTEKSWKYYAQIADVVNGKTAMTDEQMSDLVKEFPDLKKKLKLTTEGWSLESGAMDVVQNGIADLQSAYLNAQIDMSNGAYNAMMARVGTNMEELNQIQNISQAYAILARNWGNAKSLAVINTNGKNVIDTSNLSTDEQFVVQYATMQIASKKAKDRLKAANSLGSDDNEKKKDSAKRTYDKKVKEINEKQYDADFKYQIDTVTNALKAYTEQVEALKTAYDGLYEKDYSGKMDLLNQRYLVQTQYAQRLHQELDSLINSVPETSSSWSELASTLETVSKDYFEAQKNLIEYRDSVYETSIDSISDSAKGIVDQVKNAKSLLDNSFDYLKNGSLAGDGLWSTPLSPSVSKDKVSQERAEKKKLLEEEKKYQNKIQEIRQRATKEAKDYDDAQRQEELQDALDDYNSAIEQATASATAAYTDFNDSWYEDTKLTLDELQQYFDEHGINIKLNVKTAEELEQEAQEKAQEEGTSIIDKTKGNSFSNVRSLSSDKAKFYNDIAKGKSSVKASDIKNSIDGIPLDAKIKRDGHIYRGDEDLGTWGVSNHKFVYAEKYAKGGTTSQGLTITGDGTGVYAGQEAYIGQDGKLHLFNNEAQLSELPPNTRIVNAKDLQNIIKYTGMKYFYQPIENIQSATVDKFAQGNTNVSFSPIPYNALSTQALYSDVDVQAMVEETIAEINNEFNALKGNIKFSAVQNAFKNSLTDKKMYKDLSNTIVNMTSQSLDKADKSTLSDSVVGLILQNSAWDDLPNELQNKLSELNVNADNWTDWIKDSNNSLQAFNLMQDGGMSSWDLLDSNVTSLLQQAGINGKDAWDKFVQDDPLQALTLLSSSWNSMNDTIGQYMTDAQTIAANGARAIQSLQIIAPSISEQSWNALQVLIANKIQEIISLMNEVFGENTVDMNFAINVGGSLQGNAQTNPQGESAVVDSARKYLGTPYVWGGTSPSGFDCSGFVQYVLAENGKSVPRTSQEQFAGGQAVDKSNLQAGDLVFYNWQGGADATHVGIYEGNGKMIHAPHPGDVVKEVDFNSYGQNAYLGARRYYKGTEGALPGLAKLGDEAEIRGLNYPTPEILIRQKTGKAYLTGLDGTQIVNLDRGDTVIPYADTKRILNGNVRHAYANGTPNAKDAISKILGINNVKNRVNNGSTRSNNSGITNNTVQQSWDTNDFGQGVGKSHSYTPFDENGYLGSSLGYWDTSSNAWKLFKKLLDSGDLSTDENGIYTYKGARLVAMTSTFGKAGDVMRYTQDDGSVFYGIIMDEKSQEYTSYDHNPANKWGHNNGQDIVEFEVKRSAIAPAYKANGGTPPYGNLNHAITLIENLGSLEGFDFSDMPSVGGTSVLTQKMQEFMSKLQQVYGTFKTNTHTSATKVGNVKSLGDKKQSNYSFDVPFTQREKGGIAPAGTVVLGNEYRRTEATIDKKGNLVPLGDGTPQVFVSDKPFPVINADDYAKIKKYGGDKKPVQFLKNGNTSVSVNADNTDEEKEQTAEERKAEEKEKERLGFLESISKNLTKGTLDDEIKGYDYDTLKGLKEMSESWGKDDELTSEILKSFKDYAEDFSKLDDWIENDLEDTLNTYNEDFYKKYYEEQAKYNTWQTGFREKTNDFLKNPTDGDYMKRFFELADEATSKNMESVITQQEMVADNMRSAIAALKEKEEVAIKLMQDAPTATLAKKAQETLSDIRENIQDVESDFVDVMEKVTEQKVQNIKNQDSRYTREIGNLEYDENVLVNRHSRTEDQYEKAQLSNDILENYNKQLEFQTMRKNEAHQGVLDMYNTDKADERFILDNVKFDELFNADGSINEYAHEAAKAVLENMENGSQYVQTFEGMLTQRQEYTQNWLDAVSNERDLMDKIADQQIEDATNKIKIATDNYEMINKILDVRLNKEKAITSALQEQYSFQQSLRDAALDYQSELIANKNLSQWLDDDTRALLFNENDYSDMMNTINGLNNEMARAYKKYKSDINTLGKDDYYQEQQITNAYNRRIEQLKEQLEVAKQNLEVTKKNAEFQNTLKERDTRILVGDRWVNVADPEKLYNTQLEATKATMARDNLIQDNVENENVRQMEKQSDKTQEIISANQQYIDTLSNINGEEAVRHAETMESLEALIATNNALSGNSIKWANIFENSDKSIYSQIAGLSDIELGDNFSYNTDYANNQGHADEMHKAGIYSDEAYNAISKMNETHVNSKVTTDNNSFQYSQRFEHGGLESEIALGKNGDKKLAQYREDNAEPIIDYWEEIQKYIDLQNKQNGILTPTQLEEAQRLEYLRNKKIADEGLDYEQTNLFGSQKFDNQLPKLTDRFEPVTLQGMVASSNFENIMTKMMEYYASPMAMPDLIPQSPQQMPATNNSTSTTESITFTGDINVTDPVPDANAFVDSLTDKVKSQYPIIKNTKI
jgi:cell wall-associated NlpC family hydrolase|uniref:NlpC/P60 family n=1 Tax=Siphoviridae sp. ct5jB2 TaxID=2825337 RepID=A0A8S5TTC8_9CAUD|nr:MAG TPA: NlpC/P60 family [Siphoviridae sp. ct5jB2]